MTKINRYPTILIYADMEGCAGITEWDEVIPGSPKFFQSAKQMTDEINACAKGAFKAGAYRVLLNDLHWAYNNVLWMDLDSRIEIKKGENLNIALFNEEKIDAVMLIGLHAKAFTKNAILDHSWRLKGYQKRMHSHGQEIGEIGFIAQLVYEQKIPLIFVSADKAGCQEAKQEAGSWVETIETKSFSNDKIKLKKPKKVLKEIENKSKAAVKKLMKGKFQNKPLSNILKYPVNYKLEFANNVITDKVIKEAKIKKIKIERNGNIVIIKAESYKEALSNYFSIID
jgi:D-amino peptidase